MRRPDVFTLDYSHPLAQGLVFAGLGDVPSGARYNNAALPRTTMALNPACHSWAYDEELGRNVIDSRAAVGQAGHIVVGALPPITGANTFVFWSKHYASSDANGFVIWGQPTGFYWQHFTSTRWNVQAQIVVFPDKPIEIQSDKWRCWACVSNGAGVSGQYLYLDGSLHATGEGINGALSPTAPWRLMAWTAANSQWQHRGLVADPVFYNRALSPAEIALLADRTDPMLGGLVREVNPVAYFDFGGASAGTDNLTATDIVTGSPVLGTPALGQVHALTATGLTTSAPVLGTPALGQVHGLAATALTVSTPVLGTPAVGQAHSLVASALVVGSPVLGTPALSENAADVDALTADNLVVGSPVLGTPAFGQIHVLGSDGLTVSSPVLGTPSLEVGKDHLTAQDLITEGPVLGTPALRQIHALVASFSTAAPEIDAPALTQAHALIPVNLAAGSPVLGTPMLFDLEYTLQTRAELKSLGTTNFTSPLYGATHIELRCYGNYEVNEFGE